VGEEWTLSGGVCDHGTDAADGPGTWEALASPRYPLVWRRAGAPSPPHDPGWAHVSSAATAQNQRPQRGRPHARGTRAVAEGGRESAGGIGALTSGNGGHARTRPSQGGPGWWELRKGTRLQALTWDARSPRLRKVVGRESPRVTATEEPDGGNLLVRIWRGAGVGNLPAYSTTVFWRRARAPRSQAEHGAAWRWLGLDRHRRMGEGARRHALE
jgi:hypothetical protein